MPKNNGKPRRAERQTQSAARWLHWANLTNAQKLEQLTARGFGESKESQKYQPTEQEDV